MQYPSKRTILANSKIREYDDMISIRINNKYYNLLRKINLKNISMVVRSLIRVDIYDGVVEITDNDIKKIFLVFNDPERKYK